MSRDPTATRARILRAADEIATETGAGSVSLDAVAARAGVSKGGLLYHFPSKARLLQGLVEDHLAGIESRLEAASRQAGANGSILAMIDQFEQDCHKGEHGRGLMAALADDPSILAPVGDYLDRFLAAVRADATDPAMAELAFHAMQGWRSQRLLGITEPPRAAREAFVADLRARFG